MLDVPQRAQTLDIKPFLWYNMFVQKRYAYQLLPLNFMNTRRTKMTDLAFASTFDIHEKLELNNITDSTAVADLLNEYITAAREHLISISESNIYNESLTVVLDDMDFSALIRTGCAMYSLPEEIKKACTIKIDGNYNHIDFNGMSRILDTLKDAASVNYQYAAYYPDFDEYGYAAIRNNADVDISENMTEDIINADLPGYWGCETTLLEVDFNYSANPEIVEKLHNIARKYFDEYDMPYIEQAWEEGSLGTICIGSSMVADNLKEIAVFLDEVNSAIASIASKAEGYTNGMWQNKEGFGIADWSWNGEKFVITGCAY